MVLEAVGFADKIKGCDLVVTGEGRIDRQTLMGKAPSGVLAVAMAQGIPTIAIGGSVVWCEELRRSGFAAIEATTPEGMPLIEAMKPSTAKENIIRTAELIARRFTTN
jgi:glycerate kinase